MTHLRLSLFALVSSAALALGCGGETYSEEEEAGFSAEGKEETCDDFCTDVAACTPGTETVDCSSACATNELVSKAGQGVLTECLGAAGCDTSNPLVVLDCVEDGLENLPVSPLAAEFCTSSLPTLSECLGAPSTEADSDLCLESVALLADETLEELAECVDDDCSGTDLCVGLTLVNAIGTENLDSLGNLGGLGDIAGDLFPGFGDFTGGLGGSETPTEPPPTPDTPDMPPPAMGGARG